MRAWIAFLAVVTPVLAGSQHPAFAVPFACQGRASYSQNTAPVTVMFQGLAGGGTGPFDFGWDFGDGGTTTDQNPTHTYTEPGIFHAVVTVTDAGSQETCRDTAVVLVGVAIDPSCVSTANIRWVDASVPVEFDAYPVFSCGNEPFTWTWRFGDGKFGTKASLGHVYAEPGTYWVIATLTTATSSCECYTPQRISVLVPGNTGVDPPERDGGLRLEPARPNPFGLVTTIAYDLPEPGHARLTILDVGGRTVAELVNGFRPAGHATSLWQGREVTGRVVPPGLYVARLEHGGTVRSTRLVRVR